MGNFLRLSNGVQRSFAESSNPSIYDQTLTVVASGAGAGQINGPISAGVAVTLPAGQTYTSNELEVYLKTDRLISVFDYNHNSSTTVTFTFQLVVGDVIRFRIDRTA